MRAIETASAATSIRRGLLALALALSALGALAAGARAEGTPAPAWKILAASGPTNLAPLQSEVQRLTVGAAGGSFTLEFEGETTPAPLPFNATPAEVKSSLDALASIGGVGGSVAVIGGPGGDGQHPYFILFGGALANTDVGEIVVDGSGLGGYANVFTTVPGGAGTGDIAIFPTNVGGAASKGPITVNLGPLPPGIVTAGPAAGTDSKGTWSCTTATSAVQCTSTEAVPALAPIASIRVPIEVLFSFGATAQVPVTVTGGGAALPAGFQLPLVVSSQPAPAGIAAFFSAPLDAAGNPATQAGGHPHSLVTAFHLNTQRTSFGRVVPAGDIKDVNVELPPGLVGNPLITARCPQGVPVPTPNSDRPACSEPESAKYAVGWLYPGATSFGALGVTGTSAPFYNNVPVAGAAAQFSTKVVSPVSTLLGALRSEEDFGISVKAPNTAVFKSVFYIDTVFFGNPPGGGGKAFFRNATDCAEQARQAPVLSFAASTWQEPQRFAKATEFLAPVTGCEQLKFGPAFSFQPTSTQGSSGVGATAHLHIDQSNLANPNQLATPDLKQSVVTLPRGFNVNPSQANGLEACSEAQVGYERGKAPLPLNPTRFNNDPVSCPDGSKLGTAEARTPLLEEPLQGTIYLAEQEKNPFGSLIALYLVFESPRFGITLKLPGKVELDPSSGQITATFDHVPQQPVEDLTLHFRGGGPRSEFATPEVCGTYTTTGSWTPWSAPQSGPPSQTSDSFNVSGNCASSPGARPFNPSFEAGVADPIAGAYSPLVIKVSRRDGEQELRHIDFTLPPGESARLAGIPYCPEGAIAGAAGKSGKEEIASSSCPPASQIGTVDAAAGVGSEPFHTGGKAYLAGPYKGAPLSAVVITPAVAGPFDLGNVVIRSPLYVDLETAQVTAKSDPIPTILRGIPLKIRSVTIKIDRSGFAINPTNCEAMSVAARLGSSDGATASPSNRFQVGNCRALAFKPRLKLRLKGATKRSGHPALKAVVTYPKKGAYANIARAQVGLPHSEFLDQGNLDKVCKQAELRSATCPKRSIYGRAKAWTPLLAEPLEGPVYLGVGFGYKLPALVADLNGQVRILLKGRVDTTKRDGIRTTFEAVPDAPVSRFVIEMKGGKKYGLIENSENICRKPQRLSALFNAQNGRRLHMTPKIANDCGKKKRKKQKGHKNKAQGKKKQSKGGKGKGRG